MFQIPCSDLVTTFSFVVVYFYCLVAQNTQWCSFGRKCGEMCQNVIGKTFAILDVNISTTLLYKIIQTCDKINAKKLRR